MTATTTPPKTPDRRSGRRSLLRRLGDLRRRVALFMRQVIAELKKVVRPTRNELITYTSVVLVFVLAVMTFVSLLDYGFGKLVLLVFGS